jgi:hypothetical protein
VRRFLLLILFIAPNLWAQITSEKMIEKIISVEKEEEAKPILLHSAIELMLHEYAEEIGIDSKDFDQKIQAKFKIYFDSFRQRKMTEKFGKDFSTELSDEQKNIFNQGIEQQKESEFRKFARFDSFLDYYAFKSIIKDVDSKWSARIVLNLNRTRFQKLKDRIYSTESKLFNKVFVLSEINLIHMNWKDLSLEDVGQFSTPLVQSWVKWLENNPPQNVDQVAECINGCINDFYNWVEIPQDEGMKINEELLNNLWMRFSFNLRKVSFRPSINEWELEWDGSAIVLDANTKLIIGAFTIPLERKIWRGLDQKELNSQLASSMYRSGLDPLNKGLRRIQESSRVNRLKRLVVQGHQRLGDVIQLMELLKKAGPGIHLELQLDYFGAGEAQLLCFYQGEEKSFTDVLSQVKELKSFHRYKLLNDSTGVHHLIKFVAE